MDLLLNHLVKDFLIEKLKNNDNLNQSLLFWGESDLGKLTVSKAFAKSILCKNKVFNGCNQCESCISFNNNWHPDYLLIDSKSDTIKVEDTLPLFDFLLYKPQISEKRILIINNCEKLNFTTQSSLLKTLEEPKNHFIIILITTNPQKLLKTIKSRLIPIRFIKPNKEELISFIQEKYPKHLKDLDYLMKLSQNRPAQIINFLENQNSLVEKESNIKIYRNLSKTNFINQSKLIKNLISEFENKFDNKDSESPIKTYLKTIVNDWLDTIEIDIKSDLNQKELKSKIKQLKNTLQLLSYIDNYNANWRLLLETFCLTTF